MVDKKISRQDTKSDENSENKNLIVAVYLVEVAMDRDIKFLLHIKKSTVSEKHSAFCYSCYLNYIASLKNRDSARNEEKFDKIFDSDNYCC